MILQRGGEELLLTKVPDRFTTRLSNPAALAGVAQHLGLSQYRGVAGGRLVEWQVAPSALDRGLAMARRLASVQFASHVYRLARSPRTAVYLTDELTVQFAADLAAEERTAHLHPLGLAEERPLAGIPGAYVVRLTPTAAENPLKLANRLAANPAVLTAEPDLVIATGSLYRPQDDRYPQQWHLHHGGGPHLAAQSHIQAEAAWEITRGSRSVVIAVSDDGFDLNHPDLQGLGKLVEPLDLRDRDGVPLPTGQDDHGTAVAGLALGEENGQGIVGVAPGCAFLPIRNTGYIDDSTIEHLFGEAMARGAAVIVCSWAPAAVYFPLTLRQRNAITQAATQGRGGLGCVVVFAAGNANRPVSGTIQEQGWELGGDTQWLSGFAVHPDVIAVAASTSLGRKAIYSNWGDAIAVAAPSNNAYPAVSLPETGMVPTGPPLRGAAEGLGMVTSDRTQEAGYGPDSYTNTFGGTSSACPVVAGVAGLMLSVNPRLRAQEVRHILQTTADKIVDPNPDPQLGLRYGTYDRNGHSRWFGYGKVNAYRAVQAAQDLALRSRTPATWLQLESTVIVSIPDNRPGGKASALAVSQTGTVQDLRLTVTLDHDFLGDLTLTLQPPQGQPVLVQGRTLGRQTHLHTTYSLQNTPALLTLVGTAAAGTWQLIATDHAAGATGQLQGWQLALAISP